MAIRIPTYSDGQGQVALPTRRLSGFSGQQISDLQAPGRAMQQLGQGMVNLGQSIAKVEIKRQQDEARVSVLENTASLQEEMMLRDEELRRNPIAGQTHTQSMQAWFDERVASEAYAPINHHAEQMWREQSIQMRSNMTQTAIRYEAQQRIAALGASLDRSVNSMARSVFLNPEGFQASMENWDRFTRGEAVGQVESFDEFGNPVTIPAPEGNVGLLDPVALNRVGTRGRQAIADAYLSGMIRDNPLAALRMIDNGELDNGEFYGIGWERLLTLRTRAYSAASTVNEAALAGIERDLAAHVASLSAGGDGLPQFQDTATIEEAVIAAFGGQESLDYFPENQIRMNNVLETLGGQIRVARATGLITSQLSYAGPQEIALWSRAAQNVAAASDVTSPTDLFGDQLPPSSVMGVLNRLPANEALQVVSSVNSQLAGIVQQRSTDPVGWAMSSPGYDAAHDGALAGAMPTDAQAFDAHVRALDAVYDRSNQPAGARPLLSTSAASQEISAILSARDPAVLVASIVNLQERTGDHFERVWQQLTTQESGLGAEYMFLATIGNTQGMELYARGLLMTPDVLRQSFGQSQTTGGVTYDNVVGQSRQIFMSSGINMALHGGMSERIPETNAIMAVMERSVAAYMAARPATNDVQSAARAVQDLMFGPNSRLQLVSEPRLAAILPMGIQDENSTPINLNLVSTNAVMMFEDRRITEGMVQSAINERYTNQAATLVFPGSTDPTIDASVDLRANQFVELIMNQGSLVLNDDSTGFFLTVPGVLGSREPVRVAIPREDGTVRYENLTIPFYHFNRPTWQLQQTHYGTLTPPVPREAGQ